MRLPILPTEAVALSSILFPLFANAAGNIICNQVVVDKKEFDLSPLDGPRSVLQSVEDYVGDEGRGWTNTTYTIDICKPIPKKGFNECPGGTRGNVSLCRTETTRPSRGLLVKVSANCQLVHSLWDHPRN